MRRPSRLPTLDRRRLHPERWLWIALGIDCCAVAAAVFLCVATFADADAELAPQPGLTAQSTLPGSTPR
jgi:hypothetical protein